jgi:molecular chaperone GrpE (heat shock protein)
MSSKTARLQALWDSWLSLNNWATEAVEFRVYEIFKEIKQAACREFERSAARFARLGGSDENIYVCLVNLMEVYRHITELKEEVVCEDPAALALLEGICEVLGSRLKEFEEVLDYAFFAENENPVTMEKNVIESRALSCFTGRIGNLDKMFIAFMRQERPEVWSALCSGVLRPPALSLENIFAEVCLPEMYAHFQEALLVCLAELDDLHNRKVAGFYMEFIEREWEELGNIIKLQVMALESAISQNTETGEPDTEQEPDVEQEPEPEPEHENELPTVQCVLNILREAYQHTGPVIDELQQLLNTPAERHAGLTYDEFAKVVEVNPAPITIPVYESGFFTLLANETAELLEQQQDDFTNKTAARIQEIIDADKLMAEEVMAVFANLKISLPILGTEDAPAEENETEARLQLNILQGIYETIEIKIDSLQESVLLFNENGQNLKQKFYDEKPTVSEKETGDIVEAVYEAWLASVPEFFEVDKFFAAVAESDIFTPILDRVKKHSDNCLNNAEKLTFRFKKEVLLYEICTYEEILTHSASRLRESEWESMAAAERELSDAYKDLGILLENNNIAAIRPAAHEQFNAFEHEILVAEKQEGFAKGEIVKILNTGYKQNNKVILRANVIAAR